MGMKHFIKCFRNGNIISVSKKSGFFSKGLFVLKDGVVEITRFNKIAIQGKGPDGKWTRKPLTYRESNSFHLCVTHSIHLLASVRKSAS